MPATTRSKNQQKQTHLKDFTDKDPQEEKAGSPKPKRTNVKKAPKASSKRKGTDDGEEAPLEKKQKQAPTKTDEDTGSSESSKPVVINRAPVLHLWAACVAEKLYPKYAGTPLFRELSWRQLQGPFPLRESLTLHFCQMFRPNCYPYLALLDGR